MILQSGTATPPHTIQQETVIPTQIQPVATIIKTRTNKTDEDAAFSCSFRYQQR
jgi:hypothetical protein